MRFAYSPSLAKKRGLNIWIDGERGVVITIVKLFYHQCSIVYNYGKILN